MSDHTLANRRLTRSGVSEHLPAIAAVVVLALLAAQQPAAAAVLLVAVVGGLLLSASPLAAVGLLVVVIPLSRWAPHVGFYLRPYYLVALLVLMLCTWYWASGRLRMIRLNTADMGVVVFLGCCLLSFLVSDELGWSVRKLMSLVWVGLVYVALRAAIETKAALRTAIATAGVSMGIYAFGGLLVMVLFIQRQMFADLLFIYGPPRLSYLNTDPNYYALHVGSYLIFTLVMLLLQPRSHVWAKWLLILLLGSNLLLTLSRGAFLALVVVLAVIAVTQRKHISRCSALLTLLVGGAVVIVVAMSTPSWVRQHQWERLVGTAQKVATGEDTRVSQFRSAWHNFKTSPILGVGIGVSRAWEQYWRHAHSIVLEILQDAGLVGLAGYLVMVGTVVGMGLRVRRRSSDPYLRAVATASLFALLYFHLQSLTLNTTQDVMLWALMGLIVAVAIVAERQQQTEHNEAAIEGVS